MRESGTQYNRKFNQAILLVCLPFMLFGQLLPPICVNSTVEYGVDLNENNGDGSTGSSYVWTTPGHDLLAFQGSYIPLGPRQNKVRVDWGNSPVGIYNLQVVEEVDATSCQTTVPIMVELVDDAPELSLPPEITACENSAVQIDTGLSNSNYTFNWTVPIGVSNPGDVASFTTNVPGEYTVIATSGAGCSSNSASTTVIFSESPVIDDIIVELDQVTILASGAPNLEYSINGVDWFTNNIFQLGSGEVFTARVRNANATQCQDTKNGMVGFLVHNVITPNGDGINDTFKIGGLENYPNAILRVFDRYGKEIFNAGPVAGEIIWNGFYLERPLPSTTYWFIFDLGDGSEAQSGYVVLRNSDSP